MTDTTAIARAGTLARRVLIEVLEHSAGALEDIAELLRDGAADAGPEQPAAMDGESVSRFSWTAAFASQLRDGSDGRDASVIRLDGRYVDDAPGLRVLRVTERRDTELEGLSSTRKVISLLLVDVDSGRARSLSTGPDMAFEVGVEVPDGVPADFAGGAA